MNKTYYSIPIIALSMAIVFLYNTNSVMHEDYIYLTSETQKVGEKLEEEEGWLYDVLKHETKKRKSDVILLKEYETYKRALKPYFISENELYPYPIKTDQNQIHKSPKSFEQKAHAAKDIRLRNNYAWMALHQFLVHAIDSMNTEPLAFETHVQAINEPKSYEVGTNYTLDWIRIHTLHPDEWDKFELIQDEEHLSFDDFPLQFSSPQEQIKLFLKPTNQVYSSYRSMLETRKHEGTLAKTN
ncbi:MAG: hypothetical protein P1U56_08535 [Saprospiraceae bacterium]|nr:hypothetical protein [Saprospiraceae bacterium]